MGTGGNEWVNKKKKNTSYRESIDRRIKVLKLAAITTKHKNFTQSKLKDGICFPCESLNTRYICSVITMWVDSENN